MEFIVLRTSLAHGCNGFMLQDVEPGSSRANIMV